MLTNKTKSRSAVRGRDAEVALIEEKLRGACDGNSATLILDGAAGFGKTRLLAEAMALASSVDVKAGFGAVPAGDRAVRPAERVARRPGARRSSRSLVARHDHAEPALYVLRADNTPRVRDGYISESTDGHARTLATHTDWPVCRTNVAASDRACTRVPPQDLHGKEGVDRSLCQ